MNPLPIAETPQQAIAPEVRTARTADEAQERVGGPVYLAAVELPEAFTTIAEAEAKIGDLYGDARYELVWREDAWRVVVRFWRPAPPSPVARTAALAARKPLGFASTPEEARAILGAPAERVSEVLGTKDYATRARALGRATALVEHGHAEITEREGRFVVMLTFWRPLASKLAPAERAQLEERVQAPMRAGVPQANMYIGMFESLAPENAGIVLVNEEGDGRTRGE
jgi:hypothetical protein